VLSTQRRPKTSLRTEKEHGQDGGRGSHKVKNVTLNYVNSQKKTKFFTLKWRLVEGRKKGGKKIDSNELPKAVGTGSGCRKAAETMDAIPKRKLLLRKNGRNTTKNDKSDKQGGGGGMEESAGTGPPPPFGTLRGQKGKKKKESSSLPLFWEEDD